MTGRRTRNYLGHYDKAAMRFIYGEVVDVDEDAKQTSQKGKDYLAVLDGFGGIGGRTIGGYHYTNYAVQVRRAGHVRERHRSERPAQGQVLGLQARPHRPARHEDGAEVPAVR